MIQTVVSNASAPEYGQATISFPIREEDYPSVVNMLQRMGLGDPLERDCRVDEVCGNWPILKRLEKVAINLDEMDYLAKRLDSFDAQEKAKFQAAAVRFGLFDMRHLIDLTFCCQETTVITDFSDLEKVGRRHYLDVNGSSAPSEELENVDGYETALLLIGDGDGTITPYGVIYDNGKDGRLYVFEAPIDLLSYISLHPDRWQDHSYVACCGTSAIPVITCLDRMARPEEVVLCLDNDEAGHKACRRMEKQLTEKYNVTIRREISAEKDWNDDLCAMSQDRSPEMMMGAMSR